MILTKTLQAWTRDDFTAVFKRELRAVGADVLGLHRAMARGSYVSETPFDVVVLHRDSDDRLLRIKAGIFFFSVNAGSCCADDPTPLCEENEYCELEVLIERDSGEATVRRLPA